MIKRLLPTEILALLALMWGLFIIDSLVPGIHFNSLGIRPRQLDGLLGIAIAPFLHGSLFHIISNSLPLLVLTALVRLSIGASQMFVVMLLGALGSGIGVWLFSAAGLVVGASGVVFALIGFLFADAYFSPSWRKWLCAIISFFLYGGALMSLLTVLPYISWAAHFWGFIAGIITALIFKNTQTQP